MTRLLIGLGISAALLIGSFGYGFKVGANRVQAKWDAAEKAQYERGVDARKNAEETVRRIPPSKPGAKPCAIRDIYDEDCK